MNLEVLMPKAGMSTSEITLLDWLVSQGDEVKEGQVIATVETEKTVIEVEAIGDGFIDIHLPAGDAARPGQLIAMIASDLGAVGDDTPVTAASPASLASVVATPSLQAAEVPQSGERQQATPAARKMAYDNGIDLSLVVATGPRGRLVKADIEKALALIRAASPVAAVAGSPPAGEVSPEQIEGLSVAASHRLSGMRGAIASGMMDSLHGMAQLTIGGNWNADGWVTYRQKLLAQEQALGCRVSYTAMMIYALVRALRKHPYMNASIVGDEIREWNEINIGVAVSAGTAHLAVPVIRDADQKGLAELATELQTISGKVRDGSISPQELTGSTFTLTSLVKSANSWGTPVINPPNAAILATQPLMDAPVVRDGELAVGKVLPVSMTFDHRLINGMGAEEFCLTLSRYVECPELLTG